MRSCCCGALAALLLAAPVAAQSPELARVDTLLAASRFTEARASLARWLESPAGRAPQPTDAAHVLLLRGQLTTAADSALQHYLELALTHPSTPYAPEALLRLGQGYQARGDAERAAGYLERLVRDYPGAAQRNLGRLWLARAQAARRRTTEACATLKQALADSVSADLRALLEGERTACDAPARSAPATSAAATSAAASAGAYTVQIGAFRDAAAARALAKRLGERGIDARVVFVGTGTLAQVRAGRFQKRADAADLLQRVRAIVRDAVIVDDAARERSGGQ